MSLNILISSDTWPCAAVISALVELPQVAQIFVAAGDVEAATKSLPSSSLVTFFKAEGPHSLFARTGPIDALFYIPVTGQEGAKGRETIDTSIAHGVKHFVLGSVDRKGAPEGHVTGVRYFDAMAKLEAYLKEQTVNTHMSWVILQRVFYMDNINDDFAGKAVCTLWAGLPPGKKLQLVGLKDVGWFAAQTLLDAEKWKGKEVGMAGDELSFEEADRIYLRLRGSRIPQTWGLVGAGLKWAISDLRQNFEWLGTAGHGVDVEKCRGLYPEIQDFENWLKTSSKT